MTRSGAPDDRPPQCEETMLWNEAMPCHQAAPYHEMLAEQATEYQLDCLVNAAKCGERVVDAVDWDQRALSFEQAMQMRLSELPTEEPSPKSSWSNLGGLKSVLIAIGGISAILVALLALRGDGQKSGQTDCAPSACEQLKQDSKVETGEDVGPVGESHVLPAPSSPSSLPVEGVAVTPESSVDPRVALSAPPHTVQSTTPKATPRPKPPLSNPSRGAKNTSSSSTRQPAERTSVAESKATAATLVSKTTEPKPTPVERSVKLEEANAPPRSRKTQPKRGPTLSESLELLKRADRALRARQPARAKRLLANPIHPALVKRSKSLSLIAECQLGHTGRVERLWGKYKRHFPESPYRVRIKKECGALVR